MNRDMILCFDYNNDSVTTLLKLLILSTSQILIAYDLSLFRFLAPDHNGQHS